MTLGLAAIAAAACGSDTDPATVAARDPIALTTPLDRSPDPNVLEIDLEARPSKHTYGASPETAVWSFGGSIPGPLLDAKVGDRVIVHFKNSLPEPTTIHWHGIRLPAAMDGTLAMQAPIAPGASFDYAFTLKDAGLYWYHPHVRSDVQVQKGLYGAIRVRGPAEPTVGDERVLVLDDVRLKDDGSLSEYLDDNAKMMGREGNTLLVNGVANASIPVRAGATTRLRLVNAANGRFFNLRLPGHTWRVIGTDGGFVAAPYDTERLLIAPGERYDVMVIVNGAPSAELDLLNEPYERGHASGHAPTTTLAKVKISGEAPLAGRTLPGAFPPIERLPPAPSAVPLSLDEATRNGELVFTVNGAVFPDVPKVMVERGGLRFLDVTNASEMDHPFHLHGFFFQVLEQSGTPVPLERTGNKDTIIVPAKTKLRLLSRFDEPGMWMYHCHILEHAEGGMMGEIHVME
ncbi:MAG: multicopper oxidase family protein [Deltaproteobacteria bacterium]|nr:multicopper oxidase family protein [Deltaproteobacteria bacterium]